ncbi:MAG: hypothetical protein NTW03_11140, partial [Verrucomicrobia bacterium]|nr:hypothetical protein [Verrucomicrobiota bacterium]
MTPLKRGVNESRRFGPLPQFEIPGSGGAREGEISPDDGSRFEPLNRANLSRKMSKNSPSPIGWERAGVRVQEEAVFR